MTAEIRPISTDQLADRFAAMEHALRAPRLEWARDLWAGYERKKDSETQHAYLKGVCAALALRGITRGPERLYSYLYAGCALSHGFEVRDVSAGELIGKAIDRAGLTPDQAQAHLEAGTLEQVVAAGRTPTTNIKVTRAAQDILSEVPALARATVKTDGLSEAELRDLPVLGFHALPLQFQQWILKAGAGEEMPQVLVFLPDKRNPDEPGELLAPPPDYGHFLKLHMPCWVTGAYPDPYTPNHLHHVRVGEMEARPNDDTPDVLVPVQSAAHIPLPYAAETGAAHSRAYAVGQDRERSHALNRWQACAVRAYAAWIARADWKKWAEKANQERLHP